MKHKINSDWDLDDPHPSKGEGVDYPERSLLSAVVNLAVYEATHGDLFAQQWFREPDGTFSVYACLLGLNPSQIWHTIERNARVGTRRKANTITSFTIDDEMEIKDV